MEVTHFYNYGVMNEVEAGATQINHFYGRHGEEAEMVEDVGSVEEAEDPTATTAAEPPMNYFAPQKNLQELLKQPWFKAVRTKEEYDEAWTDGFIEALMASEHRDGIARDWAVQGKRNKRTQIKGYVVGLLVDAGVLKGSYDGIAARVRLTDDPRSFSRYMGEGKRQVYADWVKEYVAQDAAIVE